MIGITLAFVLLMDACASGPSGNWQEVSSLTTPRYNFACESANGKVYVFGGTIEAGGGADATASVEAYDPGSDTWTPVADMISPRTHATTAALDGKIYLIGGGPKETVLPLNTVEVYDIASDSWEAVAPMPTKRLNPAAAVVDGKIYVIGGQLAAASSGAVEIYDPAIPERI
jgi:N-acetylneuraminic acid mutarotase